MNCFDGRRIPLNSEQRGEIPGTIPYWGANGVVDYVGQALFDETLVLLGEDGAPFDDPARDVAFTVEGPVWINNHIHALGPHPDVDARFLTYALNSVDWMPLVSGSTRLKLTQDDMMSARVPERCLEEQRAIADYLDTETARIDALITKKQRMVALLDGRRDAVRQRLLDDDLAEYRSVPLRYLVAISGGLTVGGTATDEPKASRPYLRVANVQDGFLDLDEVTEIEVGLRAAKRFELRHGDVLMLEGNGNPENLGRGTIWRSEIDGCLHQNHIHSLRPRSADLEAEYLNLAVRSPRARSTLTGGAGQVSIATLSKSAIADLRIPLPPTTEQRAIVSSCEARLGELADLEQSLNQQLDLLNERRRALVTAAVTGEFRVPGVV